VSNKAFDDMSLAEQKAYLLRRSEEIDRQAGPKKRREVPDVSEKALLALGGKKVDATFVFGSEGEFQLIFRPSQKAAARWTFSIPPVPISSYDIQRELSGHGRGLWVWDKEKSEKKGEKKGKPSLAYRAAEQLLACHADEELQALRVEVRQLHELNERPEIEAVMEQFSKMKELLETVSYQLMRAQAAIGLVVEVLSEEHGGIKLKKAFDLAQGDQLPQEIQKLWDCTMFLAATLQRPPTKKELRNHYDPDERMDPAQFSRLLKPAGLSWLPSMALLRRALSLAA
jgi:hypothetical protein